MILASVIVALFGIAAVLLVWLDLWSFGSSRLFWPILLAAAVCLILPLRFLWLSAHRKWKTGSFLMTEEHHRTTLARMAALDASPRRWLAYTILDGVLMAFWIALAAFWVIRFLSDPSRNLLEALLLAAAILGIVQTAISLRRRPHPPSTRASVPPGA
jgi:hypothetical protein